jgi:hypothetical protein
MGLGLYLAHVIATAHSGSLLVTPTEDETCVTFAYPRPDSDAASKPVARGFILLSVYAGYLHNCSLPLQLLSSPLQPSNPRHRV